MENRGGGEKKGKVGSEEERKGKRKERGTKRRGRNRREGERRGKGEVYYTCSKTTNMKPQGVLKSTFHISTSHLT